MLRAKEQGRSSGLVVIDIWGGLPSCAKKPKGIKVVVHDYDLDAYPGSDEDRVSLRTLKKDKEGFRYWEKEI